MANNGDHCFQKIFEVGRKESLKEDRHKKEKQNGRK